MNKPSYYLERYIPNIRKLTELKEEIKDLEEPNITARYSFTPHGTEISNPTNSNAIYHLNNDELLELKEQATRTQYEIRIAEDIFGMFIDEKFTMLDLKYRQQKSWEEVAEIFDKSVRYIYQFRKIVMDEAESKLGGTISLPR